LKKRELFVFAKFVQQWDFTKFIQKFNDFLYFISAKYNLSLEILIQDFQEFLKEEEVSIRSESSITDDYKTFLEKHEERVTQEFQKENKFQTSVLGFKARGNFPTEEEASEFAKRTRDRDPNHSTFVGPIGIWLPWDPQNPKNVEYMEEQLNQLHKEKIKNEEHAKMEFERRVRETKEKAIRENKEKAEKTGNKLTQYLDESTGKLVGVNETVDFESREVADPEKGKEIFELLKQDALKKNA